MYNNDDSDMETLETSMECLNQVRPPEPVEADRSRVKDLQADSDVGADMDTKGVTAEIGPTTLQLDAGEVDHCSHSSTVAEKGHFARRIFF